MSLIKTKIFIIDIFLVGWFCHRTFCVQHVQLLVGTCPCAPQKQPPLVLTSKHLTENRKAHKRVKNNKRTQKMCGSAFVTLGFADIFDSGGIALLLVIVFTILKKAAVTRSVKRAPFEDRPTEGPFSCNQRSDQSKFLPMSQLHSIETDCLLQSIRKQCHTVPL